MIKEVQKKQGLMLLFYNDNKTQRPLRQRTKIMTDTERIIEIINLLPNNIVKDATNKSGKENEIVKLVKSIFDYNKNKKANPRWILGMIYEVALERDFIVSYNNDDIDLVDLDW